MRQASEERNSLTYLLRFGDFHKKDEVKPIVSQYMKHDVLYFTGEFFAENFVIIFLSIKHKTEGRYQTLVTSPVHWRIWRKGRGTCPRPKMSSFSFSFLDKLAK